MDHKADSDSDSAPIRGISDAPAVIPDDTENDAREMKQESKPETVHLKFGWIFDAFSIMVSLLDFGTDLYILSQWYSEDENAFFWIGISF